MSAYKKPISIDDEMFYKQSIILLEKEVLKIKIENIKLKEEILRLKGRL